LLIIDRPAGPPWLRRTNVWRKLTSPARGAKRLKSINRDRLHPDGRALDCGKTKHKKASIMKFVLSDICREDYKKRRSAFLNELIAATPNVSLRAKEFRRWIDENSPYSDNDEA